MSDVPLRVPEHEQREQRRRGWWSDCRRTAWFCDWAGWHFCLRHAWLNARRSGGDWWVKLRWSRLRWPF